MIVSAGLTPAWQQVLVFDEFRHGEVNRAREAHWCASGKVFNAGIATHLLGGPSLTLATVGGDPRRAIERELERLGVPFRWVVTQCATRVCTTIIDRGAGQITELVENGRPVTPEELAAFLESYECEVRAAEVAIVIGSLPAGTPASYYRDLLVRTPCPAVLDFRGDGLLSVLDLRPLVVKPNREELGQTVGRSLDNDGQLLEAMTELNRRGAQWVVVTQGSGPLWLTGQGKAWKVHPVPVADVVNPIGCGDVLAASLAWAHRQGMTMLEGARLGVAAAAANLKNLLPGRFDPTGIHQDAQRVQIEEVA